MPALGPELLLPALRPGASPRRRRRSCCSAPSRSCRPPLLLPRSGPLLLWPPRRQEPPSSRPYSGAACPSPPERPPPRTATHSPVAAPRGHRAPDPIARRSNLDLDAAGLGRGRGGNYFLFDIRRGGNWSGVAKLGRAGAVGLGRLDAGVECYSTPI